MTGIVSGGDGEYSVRRGGVPFNLVCTNTNVEHELWEGFYLSVSLFGKGRVGVGIGGQTRSGGKVKCCGWIVRIKQGCAHSQRCVSGCGVDVHDRDGFRKAHQGGGNG